MQALFKSTIFQRGIDSYLLSASPELLAGDLLIGLYLLMLSLVCGYALFLGSYPYYALMACVYSIFGGITGVVALRIQQASSVTPMRAVTDYLIFHFVLSMLMVNQLG